jgi:hypothetical protein
MKTLRSVLCGLSASLSIEKLVLDFSDCCHASIDYNSKSRIAFYKQLEKKGLRKVLLIQHISDGQPSSTQSWSSFYHTNHLSIEVASISDKKLMPLFMLEGPLFTKSIAKHQRK